MTEEKVKCRECGKVMDSKDSVKAIYGYMCKECAKKILANIFKNLEVYEQ